MSFVDKLKSVFKSKAPSYKFYNGGQLKILAMKSRIFLQQYYKKCLQVIQASDSILFQRKDMSADSYTILQQIGRHVIQAQSIKIYVQILKKIQANSASIIKTNGDIALLKTQLLWFQCLLWYRKCKKIQSLDYMHEFCYNFFKGVDVTCQINPKCELFKVHHIMLYLNPDCVVPLKKIFPQITLYIKTKLSDKVLEEIFRLNHVQIKNWVNKDQNQFRQHYLSGSKSPIKRRKTITPNKQIHHFHVSKKYTITQTSASKIQQPPKQVAKTQTPKAMGVSFMRRVMESSSKINKSRIPCAQCGVQFQDHGNGSNMCQVCNNKHNQSKCLQCGIIINSKSGEVEQGSLSSLCKACRINKLIDQPQTIKRIVCKKCSKTYNRPIDNNYSNQNPYFQEDKKFIDQFCQGCYESMRKKCLNCNKTFNNSPQHTSQNNNIDFCPQCNEIMNKKCTHCHNRINKHSQFVSYSFGKPQNQAAGNNSGLCGDCYDLLNRKCSDCNKNINAQSDVIFSAISMSKLEKNAGKQSQQLCKQCYNRRSLIKKQKAALESNETKQIGYQDQEESLRFIRESLVQKKKPAKKPYMVSIYARAQYVQNSNNM